jgi:hypothetical protein
MSLKINSTAMRTIFLVRLAYDVVATPSISARCSCAPVRYPRRTSVVHKASYAEHFRKINWSMVINDLHGYPFYLIFSEVFMRTPDDIAIRSKCPLFGKMIVALGMVILRENFHCRLRYGPECHLLHMTSWMRCLLTPHLQAVELVGDSQTN